MRLVKNRFRYRVEAQLSGELGCFIDEGCHPALFSTAGATLHGRSEGRFRRYAQAVPKPAEIVREFLRLVEMRDLDQASRYLADDVHITFPGGRTFTNLDDQARSSQGRFGTVRKIFERIDAFDEGGDTIVYSFGTLEGTSLNGEPFAGVRFIDRFVVRQGRIVDQKVWNDLAESGVLSRR